MAYQQHLILKKLINRHHWAIINSYRGSHHAPTRLPPGVCANYSINHRPLMPPRVPSLSITGKECDLISWLLPCPAILLFPSVESLFMYHKKNSSINYKGRHSKNPKNQHDKLRRVETNLELSFPLSIPSFSSLLGTIYEA